MVTVDVEVFQLINFPLKEMVAVSIQTISYKMKPGAKFLFDADDIRVTSSAFTNPFCSCRHGRDACFCTSPRGCPSLQAGEVPSIEAIIFSTLNAIRITAVLHLANSTAILTNTYRLFSFLTVGTFHLSTILRSCAPIIR
jgi:hypothetical protein